MSVNDAINIDDLRRMAKRRLPRIAYDFIEGGPLGGMSLANEAEQASLRAASINQFDAALSGKAERS